MMRVRRAIEQPVLILLRFPRLVLVSLMLVGVLVGAALHVDRGEDSSQVALAQTPTPVLTDPGPVIPFRLTGFDEEVIIRGPNGIMDHYFRLPDNWVFTAEGEVELGITTFFNIGEDFPYAGTDFYGGELDVVYNNEAIGSIPINWTGTQTHTFRIPVPRLEAISDTGYHSLSLRFIEGLDCEFDIQSFVAISPDSRFILPHTEGPHSINLQLLPRPIFQNTFLSDATVLVVPDQPSPSELQAAFATAAGFGRMTNGQLELKLKTASTMMEQDYQQNHLILVGKPDGLPLLAAIADWPVPVSNGELVQSTNVITDDGVIQMTVSPWNQAKVVLAVSGNTDSGVLKAGHAISSGTLKTATGPNNDVAVVADVREHLEGSTTWDEEQTFADLGYTHEVRQRTGEHYIEYTFSLPPGYTSDDSAYLELVYNHSAMLTFERSGISVSLNEQVIGSAPFSEESTDRTTERISIPRSVLQVGNNILAVSIVLIPDNECLPPDLEGVWATIWSDSLLHVPLEPVREGNERPADLSRAAELLLSDPTLNQVAFVVPRTQPVAWDIAMQIVFFFGKQFEGDIFEASAAYADAIPDEIAHNHDWVLVGRASTLPIIEKLRSSMPIPFDDQGDIAARQGSRIIYRFPDNVPLGYIQLFPLPEGEGSMALSVMGATNIGLGMAGAALIESSLNWQLQGNFAIVRDKQIVTGDTRTRSRPQELAATLVPTSTVTTVALTETMAMKGLEAEDLSTHSETRERPGWIVPAIGVLTAMIVLLLAGVGIMAFLRHRSLHKSHARRG
jgi:hypothetical protein